MKIERKKDPRVSDGMVGMTRRRGRIGSRGFSFGKNLADWALFFRETTVPLYPFVLEMLISRSGCSFRWLFGGIGVDPKPAFPTRITFDPVGFGDVDISEWMLLWGLSDGVRHEVELSEPREGSGGEGVHARVLNHVLVERQRREPSAASLG